MTINVLFASSYIYKHLYKETMININLYLLNAKTYLLHNYYDVLIVTV